MSTKTIKKGINIVSISSLTLFAVVLWGLNLIGTQEQRQLIEFIFIAAFIPVVCLYAKFFACTERKRIKALRKKTNNYKKKRKRS